jgi:hypothetical protein
VPISTAGGGYFGVNVEVAGHVRADIETRFGADAVWVLNPAAPEAERPPAERKFVDLGPKATGADYMYMWTRILEGPGGLGEDFDFFYFVGPADVARFFGFTGDADMAKVDAYFDRRLAADAGLRGAVDAGSVSKRTFRNYYALRASIAFSYGSHDEWNIAGLVSQRRRGAAPLGLAEQLSVFFDGRAVPPSSAEQPVAAGDAGRCVH